MVPEMAAAPFTQVTNKEQYGSKNHAAAGYTASVSGQVLKELGNRRIIP